ncbi:MAG: methyltransferase domain-containing protein [Lachnospiraceae bacterium]
MSDINYIEMIEKTDAWIHNHTISNDGIVVTSKQRKIYPEVTGYFIPTLLKWGYRDYAINYARYLCNIQREDGAWCAPDKITPYVFDTGQVLKGLLAVRLILPTVKAHVLKGCDWIVSNIQEDGRLTTPSMKYWKEDGTCSELIHLYCLSPLIEAGQVYDREDYITAAQKVLQFYKQYYIDDILNFKILSHFHAYIMEALLELGERKLVDIAMDKMAAIQDRKGYIPAYQDADWVCSTGVFQLASVWYRLGDSVHGDCAFQYACQLQNQSGGWYGSYMIHSVGNYLYPKRFKPTYFPSEEISWAVKYFLDAFYYKQIHSFELQAPTFLRTISKKDERYQFILNQIIKTNAKQIGDIGCGKGRYMKKISKELPDISITGVDLSWNVMQRGGLTKEYDVKKGSILNIPYPNDFFDLIYTAEVLEHAVHISNAIKEILRVLKPGGTMIIIDKNMKKQGQLQLDNWEQWFEQEKLVERIIEQGGMGVEVWDNIGYGGRKDGLFTIWTAVKDIEKEENV